MMKVVIVGGVAGGMSAATRLRRLDENADITVYEAGPDVSFANCGLPYFIGGVIGKRESLLLQTPESLAARFNLDVRVNSRVLSIDRAARTVTVRNSETNETFTDSYDSLILSPGAAPRQLVIPGWDRALTLRSLPDADRIVAAIGGAPKHIVILGAGFIGVEVAENLRHRGHSVSIVQSGPSILSPFDPEMIEQFHVNLERHGIQILVNTTATEITEYAVELSDGARLTADVVISSVGVTPDHALAVEAGLRIGAAGGIWVDNQQRTSDPAIYAVGDAAEKQSAFTDEDQMVWLANLANRHGRLVADVVAGLDVTARPSVTTGIVGAFGMAAAITGLSEKSARRAGIVHQVMHLHPSSHAGYYPGAETMSLKVVFAPDTGAILGAQAVGNDGADKRIDVIATAIYGRLTVSDLMNLELAYAPQFASAKDAINQAGYVGDNIMDGRTPTVQWHELEERRAAGAVLIDVRTADENQAGAIPGSLLIPVDDLRNRLEEIPAKDVIVHCKVGQRGHTATQLLRSHGIRASNLDGGYLTWRAGMDSIVRSNSVSPFTNN
ncbi:MAG: CoA-disulfide reductase [Actinobacteria bacterium]|nr:CoA-disulfide reductase [Actinomycetota bacterium]